MLSKQKNLLVMQSAMMSLLIGFKELARLRPDRYVYDLDSGER